MIYTRPTPFLPVGAPIWRFRYERSGAELGEDHPRVQAALGRLYAASESMVPTFYSRTPAAVAWRRYAAAPGYDNRHERRRRRRIARAAVRSAP